VTGEMEELLAVENLKKHFPLEKGVIDKLLAKERRLFFHQKGRGPGIGRGKRVRQDDNWEARLAASRTDLGGCSL